MSNDVYVAEANWQSEAESLQRLRREVFVDEQKVPAEVEFDGRDEEAIHFIARDSKDQVVGCARLLPDGQIGRMAVALARRRDGIGRLLLDAAVSQAREHGHYRVFLHAQSHAVQFYAEAGFARDGEPFMEAGIPHLPMSREFPIEFEAAPDLPAPVLKQEPPPVEPPLLEDVEPGFTRLDGDVQLRDTITDLASRARRLIRIYSQEFDARLFDNEPLRSAISAFARAHPNTRLQVIIHNSGRIVRDGHGIVELRHRLPSSIEIRKAHDDQYETHFTYVLIDNTAYLMMPRHFEYAGYCNYADAARVRRHNVHFDEQWGRALPDPNLRLLTI